MTYTVTLSPKYTTFKHTRNFKRFRDAIRYARKQKPFNPYKGFVIVRSDGVVLTRVKGIVLDK